MPTATKAAKGTSRQTRGLRTLNDQRIGDVLPDLADVSVYSLRMLNLAVQVRRISDQLVAIDNDVNHGEATNISERLDEITNELWSTAYLYSPEHPCNRTTPTVKKGGAA